MLWRLTIWSFRDGLPDLSNFYCLPGRAGGSPNGLAYFRRLFWDYPPIVTLARIKELAGKAVKLDSKLPRAHTMLAAFYLFGAWIQKAPSRLVAGTGFVVGSLHR